MTMSIAQVIFVHLLSISFVASQTNWIVKERIVGGKPVELSRFYTTAIFRKYSSGFKSLRCGGTLISSKHVLTAAHCVRSQVNMVQIGLHNLRENDPSNEDTFVEIAIVDIVIHPNYDPYNDVQLDYDYAICELKSSIDVALYPPISLNENLNIPQIGQELVVMGWGRTTENGVTSDTLLETTVNYISLGECESIHGREFITDRMICAYTENHDACQGDSGGPLIIPGKFPSEDILVGIVSWGYGCATPGYPGVYSNISLEYNWIKGVVCRSKTFLLGGLCDDRHLETVSPSLLRPSQTPTTLAPVSENISSDKRNTQRVNYIEFHFVGISLFSMETWETETNAYIQTWWKEEMSKQQGVTTEHQPCSSKNAVVSTELKYIKFIAEKEEVKFWSSISFSWEEEEQHITPYLFFLSDPHDDYSACDGTVLALKPFQKNVDLGIYCDRLIKAGFGPALTCPYMNITSDIPTLFTR